MNCRSMDDTNTHHLSQPGIIFFLSDSASANIFTLFAIHLLCQGFNIIIGALFEAENKRLSMFSQDKFIKHQELSWPEHIVFRKRVAGSMPESEAD